MRLEIDTQHDSPETIRKAIELLRSIVGESAYSNASSGGDIFGNSAASSPTRTPNSSGEGLFGNLFEPSSKSQESSSMASGTPAEETNEEEEVPEIIPY